MPLKHRGAAQGSAESTQTVKGGIYGNYITIHKAVAKFSRKVWL